MPLAAIPTLLVLIPALPLAAAIVTAVFGRGCCADEPLAGRCWRWCASFVASLMLLFEVQRIAG